MTNNNVISSVISEDELNNLNSTICDGLKVQAAGGTGFRVKCVLPNRCTVLR